jgi:hypothetical protein
MDQFPLATGVHTMGIFSAAQSLVVTTFGTIERTFNGVDQLVEMGTSTIEHHSVMHKQTHRQRVVIDAAKSLEDIQRSLDSDDALKARYDALMDCFEN